MKAFWALVPRKGSTAILQIVELEVVVVEEMTVGAVPAQRRLSTGPEQQCRCTRDVDDDHL